MFGSVVALQLADTQAAEDEYTGHERSVGYVTLFLCASVQQALRLQLWFLKYTFAECGRTGTISSPLPLTLGCLPGIGDV